MSEKKKPGPKAGEKPMGMTSQVTLEDQVAILRERVDRLEKLEAPVKKLYRHHYGGNSI
jgi:uncharacterized small protein (DUF1192 family)